MFTTGSQIRAARALIGLRRCDLAVASGIHTNAVSYWERQAKLPRRETYAINRMRKALEARGVVPIVDPSPGIRLVVAPVAPPSSQRLTAV